MAEHSPALAEQFEELEQQKFAGTLGMWIFLATEIMFFGGMFAGYTIYRTMYPAGFAEASRHTNFALGTLNTFVLLASSLAVVLALDSAHKGNRKSVMFFLSLTIALGLAFLGCKGIEYYQHYQEHLLPGYDFVFDPALYRPAALFMCFYFALTGIHALHMIIGIGLMTFLLVLAYRRRIRPEHPAHVEIIGLYWHFVDIVWLFIYPLIYLVDRHK